MAEKESDKGFQDLPLPMEARAAMKSHVHLLGQEDSSCKGVINKDGEILTHKMENKDKERILVKKKRRVAPKDQLMEKEARPSAVGDGCRGHTCLSSQEGKQQEF